MSESYPEYFKGAPVGSLGKFDQKNASGCQLASVGPRKLTKMIKFYIQSMEIGFYYSNSPYIIILIYLPILPFLLLHSPTLSFDGALVEVIIAPY